MSFAGARILVVGGAGFVGSNLVRLLLAQNPRGILIVDNMLSADPVNVPDDPAVRLVVGSITDDGILADLPGDLGGGHGAAALNGVIR